MRYLLLGFLTLSACSRSDRAAGYRLESLHKQFSDSPEQESIAVPAGEFLYGLHSVHSALVRERREIFGLLTDKEPSELSGMSPQHAQLVEKLQERQIPIITTQTGRLEQLSGGFGNRHSSAILACSAFRPINSNLMRLYDDKKASDPVSEEDLLLPPNRPISGTVGQSAPVWLVLDRIQDPHNMGAILRSAWFYGIDGVVLPLRDTCPVNPTCANISTGAVEQLPIYSCSNLAVLIKTCSENGWATIGTCSNSATDVFSSPLVPLGDVQVTQPTILILGNEGAGVSTAILQNCSSIVQIPSRTPLSSALYGKATFGTPAHEAELSLNVSVAAGVLLHHLTGQRASKE